MTEKKRATPAARRDFLKLAGAGSVAGVAAAVSPRPAETAESGEKRPGSAGYRETPHVKKVYALSKF